MNPNKGRLMVVSPQLQTLSCYEDNKLVHRYIVSTAKNGLGEEEGSECTPRGRHAIHSIIGLDAAPNYVFIGRVWTGEIYSPELAAQHPTRDWILTRILRLEGLEPGFNQGGTVDSFSRYIYIHGTPDETTMGEVGSRGCIRMKNADIIELATWAYVGLNVFIESY